MKKIVIIGSSWKIDKPIIEELLKAGFQLTALVNYKVNDEELKGFNNISFLNGDSGDIDNLRRAFRDHDGVYLNLFLNPSGKDADLYLESDILENVIVVAKETGIKRISHLSSLIIKHTDNCLVLKAKKQAVDILKNSDIPFTIFYPSHFMETIINFKCGNTLMVVGNSNYPNHWISVGDFGKQVARSFEIDEENREYVIQGPEAYSMEEAFEIFVRNYKTENLKIKKMPLGLLKYIGKFSIKIDQEAKMADCLNNFPEKFEGREAWDRLGEPAVTIEEFAKQY